ncbi:DEAD/DEAH box helicase [Desulfobacter latus]|uniref:DEAD/DEAH box helicase n=1 Tax=Desulfobacter latus TaxID=2292 RepID=A0A850TAI1_9BACT|nr:DEAD/DEAH box helicase [Desulfobacter latus]NWH06385.1 DEAD/DEAH box helicase [Desulfobacter latus]
MVQDINALFEVLGKTKRTTDNLKVPATLAFKMVPTDRGISLSIVDGSGKEVNPGYEFYSGPQRAVLKEIARLREQEAFTIDWDEQPADNQFYLNGKDYLLSLLLSSDCFVDAAGEKIKLAPEDARVRLSIVQRENQGSRDKTLETSMELWHGPKQIPSMVPVTQTHMLAGNSIYRVKPLGKNYDSLSLFETVLGFDLLEQYLTLVFSNLTNVDISYSGYTVIKGEPKTTQPALIFENVSQDQSLHLRVSATYPGFSPDFFDNFDMDQIVSINEIEEHIVISPLIHGDISACFRDIQKTLKRHARDLKQDKGIYAQDNFMVIESALARRFITMELSSLLSRYTILGADKLASYKVKYVQPKLNLHLSHGIDFLEGEGDVILDGETFTINDVLKQYQKNAYVRLNDGSSAVINPDYMEKLARIFKKQKTGIKVSFFDLPLVEELIGEKIANETFNKSRNIFLGFNQLKNAKTRLPAVNATLRGYQKQGVRWLSYLYTHKLGGCLADDMGLGKTIQTIALLASIYPDQEQPTLIVMPKTLLFNWESELKRFAPKLTSGLYYGQTRDIKTIGSPNIILTTYAMVRNDIEQLKEEHFHMVVLDESQNIKNPNSKTSRAVMLLQTDHRFALSGTPIENNMSELYALFRFLNPAMFGSFSDFSKNYLNPIQKNDNKAVAKELKKKIYPFVLRRLKTQVLKDLPDKMEQVLHVDMSREQAALYHQRRLMYKRAIQEEIQAKGLKKSKLFILQAMGELRQIASIPEIKSDNKIISPKREILMEHVADAVAGKHKVLVFANYLHSLECVSQDMADAGIHHLIMTGATRDRNHIVEQFQQDDTCQALLMTLKTGGLGLNLTAAEYVFLFDPWWNLAAENQAIDRAHRMGQKNTVFSYRLIARDSIEEKILMLQEKKKALFDSLIASDNASIKQMEEEDIDLLLGE